MGSPLPSRISSTAFPPAASSTFHPMNNTPAWSFIRQPMWQLFGVVLLLFILTVILGLINFCIFYFEKRRRRGPVHWRSAPIGDAASSSLARPINQPPKRSFHIQHALYKTVRRPSSMPP